MSSNQGLGDQTDFSKLPRTEDGSFERQISSFPETIQRGGKFEPESGALCIVKSAISS